MKSRESDAVSVLFSGGGAAGEVLRAVDWSRTPLGSMSSWPHALRAHVRAILHSHQPTCIFWGRDYVNIYNDGFIPLLGEKHPRAMGALAREVWSDAWPVVGAQLDGVLMRGEAVLSNEMLVPIVRGGRLDDAWFAYSYSPLFDDDGKIGGILVAARETTAEVRAREQLEAARLDADGARQEMQAVFMQAPLPIALLRGPEHRFSLVNDPYRVLVGGRALDGLSLREAFTEEEVGYYLPHIDRVFRTGEPLSLQEAPLRLAERNGVVIERYIDVGYQPYRGPDGVPLGVIAIIHDVTSKVLARAEEARLRSVAEAASHAKDEFLATVSHELRNPLNAMLGWSRMLRGETEPARIAKGLAVIERNASTQATLIDDILDMSRVVSGKLTLALGRVRVMTVVRNAAESIRPALAAKRLKFELRTDDEDVELVADSDRLQQVVWNLLSNAAKFTPEGGSVRLDVRRADRAVKIRVADDGRGIAREFLPFVFDRFRQADASTTKRQAGMGLGLSIVRHVVELHGGRVQAFSDGEGRGAAFEVTIPVHALEPRPSISPAVPELGAERGLNSPVKRARPLEGLRVLVVDDQADARELVVTVLLDAGAQVTEAGSVGEALAALSARSIDVLVSDVGMPSEDGYALVRAVRMQPRTRKLPALALTAYARAEDRAAAKAAGFDDHLAKPAEPDELVRRVALLAGRT